MNPVQRPLENVLKHPPIIMDLAVSSGVSDFITEPNPKVLVALLITGLGIGIKLMPVSWYIFASAKLLRWKIGKKIGCETRCEKQCEKRHVVPHRTIDQTRSTALATLLLHCTNGHQENPSTSSKDPVPSPYHREGKRRKDNDPAKGLWDNGEPCYLPGKWPEKRGSTWIEVFIYGSGLTSD